MTTSRMARGERRLRVVGVELVDAHNGTFACLACGQHWSPCILPGGRLPRGYYRCPNGCNEDQRIR